MTMRTKPNSDFVPGLVSVIIPTKDRASMVCDTLQSVFHQIYRPIEILVVDDGSVDETESVVGDWALQTTEDEQFVFRYIKQPSAGAPAARNRGFAASRGEFIQFLDSDDLLHHDKLRDQVRVFHDDPAIDYVYSGAALFRSAVDWEAKAEYGKPDCANLTTHIKNSHLNTICGIYRRRICTAIGDWDEQLEKWQDWEYNARLLAAGARCAGTPGVRALIRRHSTGQIADLSRVQRGLDSMVHAVSRTEAALVDSARYDRTVAEALATRWSLVAAEAIRWGHPGIAVLAIKRGRHHASTRSRKLRLNLLRLLALLPPEYGSIACNRLLAVAHARSRSAAAHHVPRSAKCGTASVAS